MSLGRNIFNLMTFGEVWMKQMHRQDDAFFDQKWFGLEKACVEAELKCLSLFNLELPPGGDWLKSFMVWIPILFECLAYCLLQQWLWSKSMGSWGTQKLVRISQTVNNSISQMWSLNSEKQGRSQKGRGGQWWGQKNPMTRGWECWMQWWFET